MDKDTTDFGFKHVPRAEKQARVRGVFDRVAARYDVMNDLMSGGLHRVWKARMVEALYLPIKTEHKITMLDVAGGTGDIARRAWALAQARGVALDVCVIDINHEMLDVARQNPKNKNTPIKFMCGDAEHLPLADNSADIYTIAFGMRNMTDRARALREAWRVLKPGGRFVCLEFSQVPHAMVRRLYDAYSFQIIPAMGQLVIGEREPYQYLVESIRRFPAASDFADEIAAANFARVGFTRLSGGIAALHYAWRL